MQPVLLHDTSVLLNLLATDRFEDIGNGSPWRFAICTAVAKETLTLWNAAKQEREVLSLAPHVASGLLEVLDTETDEERESYLAYASLVGQGEAMCIALARTRGLELATDDKKARRLCSESQPVVRVVSTPEVLSRWQQKQHIPAVEMGIAIRNLEVRSKFLLKSSHPHFQWWQDQRLAVGGP